MENAMLVVRQIIIGFGIAIMFPMLIYYGVATVTPPPRYEAYFPQTQAPPMSAPKEERDAYYAQLQVQRQQANRDFQLARARFAQKLIVVMVPLGVAAILGGYFLGVNAIGSGLLLGGIITVAFGYAGYWGLLYPWMRFASLAAGMLMLIFIGYKHLGQPSRKETAPPA
jgi:hypothetical protein